jgi:ribosomal protein S27AE
VIEVERKRCPAPQAYGQTHHLVAVKQRLTCAYCGKTEKQIREEHDNGDDS